MGIKYKGVLYGQFMITREGMKVVEFNARFGDPEAMNVLTLLKSDFVDVCEAIVDGSLDKMKIDFERSASVCKYVVPEGYPDSPVKNAPLTVDEKPEFMVYYASVNERDGKVYTTSSRSLAVVGVADNIADAEIALGDGAGERARQVPLPPRHRQGAADPETDRAHGSHPWRQSFLTPFLYR